jgi:endonuclease/exonuclease/phosphatase family metal-dependent hydrolase
MTYNIRNGGQPDRLDAVVDVITAHRPDLLALQELRGFDQAALDRLATATGMAAYLARSRSGQPVAVLVRAGGAVTAARRVRGPFQHAAAEVTVATDGGPLTVIGTHLCPYSGRWRLAEARALARRVDPDGLLLLMGDLNSLDPWTDHAERVRSLPPRYRSRHLWRGTVDTRAVAALADAGLVDLFRPGGQDHSVPTHLGGTEFARMRLDYLLGTEPLAALTRSYRIVSGGAAETASDHYPVLAEMDLTIVCA